jgi:hypothetical protein
LNKIIERILNKNNFIIKYSEEFTKGRLKALVSRAIESNYSVAIITKLLQMEIDAFDAFNETRNVFLLLTGLEIGAPLSLGNVEIKPGDSESIRAIVTRMSEVVCENRPELSLARVNEFIHSRIEEPLLRNCFVQVQAKGEAIKAREQAIVDTRVAA